MKIYTRTGDRGQTSLFSGGRVEKDDSRIEAYGTVDELSSVLGVLLAEPLPEGVAERLRVVQKGLFGIGSALADAEGRLTSELPELDVEQLEAWIDLMEGELLPLASFVLPGGCRAAAVAHVSRSVCRRAERRVLTVRREAGGVPEETLKYLNRLSDCLFVLARFLNARLGVAEVLWRPRHRGEEQGS